MMTTTKDYQLSPKDLLETFLSQGFDHFLGVPDSTLKTFLAHAEKEKRLSYQVVTNECEAIGMALGHYMASGKPSVVFLQNSGLSKAIHPLITLACKEVCHLPVLLLIGHRGHPKLPPDEPQHKLVGLLTENILETIQIPYEVLQGDRSLINHSLAKAHKYLFEKSLPYALIVRPDLFSKEHERDKAEWPPYKEDPKEILRYEALKEIVMTLPRDTFFVASTGKISRELFFIREELSMGHEHDFYTVGGMGVASAIACGLSQKAPEKKICLLEGDGAALMHLNHWATLGNAPYSNLFHILLDNEAHESTGGQKTISKNIDFQKVALGLGYKEVLETNNKYQLTDLLKKGPSLFQKTLLVLKILTGSDPKLGRPTTAPKDNAQQFRKSFCS